jgi:D-alanyl-lipoteichoic acid acyltransferase DltB (MBOAT superfamily)
MLFNSPVFIFVFLPITLLGFYLLALIERRLAAAWLGIASLVFYQWWNPRFLILLLVSIVFNYVCSQFILSSENAPRRQSALLIGGIAANLAALFYFKYLFHLLNFVSTLGWHGIGDDWSIVLPLGISFFTFTQIGYLVDCKQGLAEDHDPISYVLFVTFFPHLIAGPILHHKEMMPQFSNPGTYVFRSENMSVGLSMFTMGLAKKVLIADGIADWSDGGFADIGHLQMFGAWGAALVYSLQLYFDFSGYSDMAIGLARMFGVRFPLNFNSPYKARCIIDFWQRWHMTLTRYLTLYLYNPLALYMTRRRLARGLSVSRKATANFRGFATLIAVPMAVTMGLAGIWHGAGLQFLVFGLLHAFYLTANHAWRVFGPKMPTSPRARSHAFGVVAGQVAVTYLCVLVAQIYFRADSAGAATDLIGRMLGSHGVEAGLPVPDRAIPLLGPLGAPLVHHGLIVAGKSVALRQIASIAALFLAVWTLPNSAEILALYHPALTKVEPASWGLLRWRPTAAWSFATAVVLFVSIGEIGGASRFLYFQF